MTEPQTEMDASARRDRFLWVAVGIFAFALVVRAFHLWQIRAAPFFSFHMGDARILDASARRIAAGDWLGDEVFYYAPLYQYFLAVIYTIFTDHVLVVRVCHSIIGSFSCVLLADAGRRFFSKPAGVAAGLMLALYAPAIFFDGLFHKTVLAFFFLCLALWLLSRIVVEPRRPWSWLQVGLAMGCLILTRENALAFVVVVLLWLFLHYRGLGNQRLVLATVLLVGLAVVLLPVAVRNRIVGGEFYLTTSNVGRNVYIGNNEHANGTYMPVRFGRGDPRYELQDDTELAQQAMGKKLTPAEVSRYWTRRALNYITSRPGAWLRLMGRKLALLWNATEIGDTEDQYTYADWSTPLRLTGYVCHFGVIAPLALCGVWVTWQKRDQLWLLYLMLATYAASVVVFFVFGRYRYPLVAFLVLFASAGLAEMRRFLRENSFPRIGACIAATIAMGVFCNWPMTSKHLMRALTYSNTGTALLLEGKLDEAISHYRHALQVHPNFVEAHYQLGLALASQGKLDEAISHYRQTLRVNPHYAEAHYSLGCALGSQGKLNEAISHYRQTLRVNPHYAEAHHSLGCALGSQGKPDEAISHYRQTLRVNPHYAEAHCNLGSVLQAQGRLDEAISHLRRALEIKPHDASVHAAMGNTLLMQGKSHEAITRFRQALEVNPAYAEAHYNLGLALTTTGRLDTALKHLGEAVRLSPDSPVPLNTMAWILATQPDSSVRQRNEAIRLAERASELTRYQSAQTLDTLAAAYAAAGRFDRAVMTGQAALALASAAQPDGVANAIRKRLELYRQEEPYREPMLAGPRRNWYVALGGRIGR